jgi:hypothetical protein
MCDIPGIVKPSTSVNELTATGSQDVNKLTQKDILVLFGVGQMIYLKIMLGKSVILGMVCIIIGKAKKKLRK